MIRKTYSYVEIRFPQESKNEFNKIVEQTVEQSDLYFSPNIERINGNVTEKLHMTLFYGLEKEALENEDLKKILQEVTIKELKLGKLFLMSGYQNLYKILCVEVLDEDKYLAGLVEKIRPFCESTDHLRYAFKPHVTLAYVDYEYNLPENMPQIPEGLPISGIDISMGD